jgi:hypothetical protein
MHLLHLYKTVIICLTFLYGIVCQIHSPLVLSHDVRVSQYCYNVHYQFFFGNYVGPTTLMPRTLSMPSFPFDTSYNKLDNHHFSVQGPEPDLASEISRNITTPNSV